LRAYSSLGGTPSKRETNCSQLDAVARQERLHVKSGEFSTPLGKQSFATGLPSGKRGSVEEQDASTTASQVNGRRATRDARADDDDVVHA
jgi:hypothetical protein